MYLFESSMNNNVALARDEQGKEVILIGNGIGFNKIKGDIIEDTEIEKIFHLFSP